MTPSLLFGDVFRYNNREYIFLAKTEEILYAAQILGVNESQQIDGQFKKRIAQGKDSKFQQWSLYCYVMLQTQEFKQRMAHMNRTGKDDFGLVIEKLPLVLAPVDIKCLKEEILKAGSPLPIELKEIVNEIDIDS